MVTRTAAGKSLKRLLASRPAVEECLAPTVRQFGAPFGRPALDQPVPSEPTSSKPKSQRCRPTSATLEVASIPRGERKQPMRHDNWIIATLLLANIASIAAGESPYPIYLKDGRGTGYVDTNGHLLFTIPYESAGSFRNGLAAVRNGRKIGFINRSGQVVMPFSFDRVLAGKGFQEGLVAVGGRDSNQNIGVGFADTAGGLIIPLRFTAVEDFSEGVAAVEEGLRKYFIDHSGHQLFGRTFKQAFSFSNGLAPIVDDAGCGYIDHAGRDRRPPKAVRCGGFSEGLAAVSFGNGLCGYIDVTMTLQIAPLFTGCGTFREGLASVDYKGGSQFIDRAGRKACCNFAIDDSQAFSHGMAAVLYKEQWGYVSREGKLQIPFRFPEAQPFDEDGVAAVRVHPKRPGPHCLPAYIDRNGTIIWRWPD